MTILCYGNPVLCGGTKWLFGKGGGRGVVSTLNPRRVLGRCVPLVLLCCELGACLAGHEPGVRKMPERERGLRRRRNAGQDASGTHHNIARDVLPPPEMLAGTRTSYENPWRFVLGCLSRRSGSADPPPRVKMLDTVLMDGSGGGQAENFFFTGADGTVQRKAQRLLRCAVKWC